MSTYAVKKQGFTLLEILLVLLLIGIASSYVMFNAFSVSQADRLHEQARRFQVVVDMASDFAVLNQLQLGIRFEQEDNQYYFMALDEDDQWQLIDGNPLYQEQTLPEQFSFDLNIDDLPWVQEEQLFDGTIFDEELSVSSADVQIGDEEDKPLPPPQVLIMSSGEITPFRLELIYEPEFNDDLPVYFYLNNKDVPPLEIDGPLNERNDG